MGKIGKRLAEMIKWVLTTEIAVYWASCFWRHTPAIAEEHWYQLITLTELNDLPNQQMLSCLATCQYLHLCQIMSSMWILQLSPYKPKILTSFFWLFSGYFCIWALQNKAQIIPTYRSRAMHLRSLSDTSRVPSSYFSEGNYLSGSKMFPF